MLIFVLNQIGMSMRLLLVTTVLFFAGLNAKAQQAEKSADNKKALPVIIIQNLRAEKQLQVKFL